MTLTFAAALSAVGLFAGMLASFELGRRLGRARRMRLPDASAPGAGPVEAAVFGLLGLLLALTLSGAASRFEARRHLIAEEANAIGTAYLRLNLLPADAQPELRRAFREYVDLRVEAYRRNGDPVATGAGLDRTATLQREIWTASNLACRSPESGGHVPMLLLPALNAMFDVTTTRLAATRNHPPRIIFLLLAGLSLLSALLVGYALDDGSRRNVFYMLVLAGTMALTFYVILDLEYPRQGLIRVDDADQTLIELRQGMH